MAESLYHPTTPHIHARRKDLAPGIHDAEIMEAIRVADEMRAGGAYAHATLANKTLFDEAVVHPAARYADTDVDLRLGVTATAVDPATHEASLADGSTLSYTKLLLATGSTPRRPPIPGEHVAYAELPCVYTDQCDLGMEYLGHVIDQVKPLVATGTPVDPNRLADPHVADPDLAAGHPREGGS